MKYAILTFGCRVNQADSFDVRGEPARARRRRGPGRRGRPRRRQHLLGDRRGRPGRPQPHPPHRPRATPRRGSSSPAATPRGSPTRWRRCRGVVRARAERRERTRLVARRCPALRRRATVAVRDAPRARRDGPHGLPAARADRLRGTLRLLHHSVDARPVAQPAARRRCSPTSSAWPAAGFKELWLVGVHLGSYGRDLGRPSSLLDLLRALDGAAAAT